jgi:diguanylate cyclase (GGDEF)-like protein
MTPAIGPTGWSLTTALENPDALRGVVDRLTVGVTVHDATGLLVVANPAARRILGCAPTAPRGRFGLLPDGQALDEAGEAISRSADPAIVALATASAVRDVVVGLRHADGAVAWLLVSAEPEAIDGEVVNVVCTFSDITEQRRAHERIRHLAQHDGLTQLPNRELLLDRLGVALVQARRRAVGVALVFVDLDNFKVINDSLGHSAGDAVLRTVARRLRSAVREADTVARLGGDEFVVLLNGIESAQDVVRVVGQLQATLRRPLDIDGRELSAHASLGVALYPQDGVDAETLLRHADTAMYRAKELGRDQTEFYTPALGARVREQLDIDARLRRAVAAGELELHYQPVLELADGSVRGVEALVRWRHDGALVPPDEFIPAAETMGAIHVLGTWVLDAACRSVASLSIAAGAPVTVAVNLSARQFHAPDFVEIVRGTIAESGCPPQSVVLEITESAALHGRDATLEKLERLKALGARLAIDDFGTGFSSFAYLQRFPLDMLKVDRSFVRDVTRSRSASGITRAIVAVGHELGLRVVAEGVETEAQARLLKLLGCDAVQGYLWGAPVPLEELAKTIDRAREMWLHLRDH